MPRSRSEAGAEHWHSLLYFNCYRLIVALVLLGSSVWLAENIPFGHVHRGVFVYVNLIYIGLTAAAFAPILWRQPAFHLQLSTYVGLDIVAVTLMIYASGGVTSGLGLLLLPSLAAAGLMAMGHLTLFYAAVASIGILGEQLFGVVFSGADSALFLQAGLISAGYFATAWLGHSLAGRAVAIEAIVAQREVDLASMAQINKLIIQDMQDGVLVVDEDGVIRQINTRAEQVLGALPREREVQLAEYSLQLADHLRAWRANPAVRGEPMQTPDGGRSIAARFRTVGRGQSAGVVVFLEDLSRVQRQAQQMKLASLGRLTANIAHEIRNPLSAINHAAELLIEDTNHSSGDMRLLQIIHDNTQRLDRMVQDVLRLNRRDRALRETFSVVDYLRVFVGQFAEIEKVDEGVIRIDAETEPEVTFDRSHLNQIMWNLCRNALRYCRREEGSITLAVRRKARTGSIELSVRDDGPGVADALKGNLFEPFFTTASSGTGLGLYIAREICEANGATLDYVDVTNGGAQFSVLFKGAQR
ncbi:MAG: histidine kinase dimerization/phospho-acceptor domain-containing protein [Burkholderiales bacterium]|jgi:two-component system sensor histidine kinase PilS (NtrC family)